MKPYKRITEGGQNWPGYILPGTDLDGKKITQALSKKQYGTATTQYIDLVQEIFTVIRSGKRLPDAITFGYENQQIAKTNQKEMVSIGKELQSIKENFGRSMMNLAQKAEDLNSKIGIR